MPEDESVLHRASAFPDESVAYGADPDQIADIRYGTHGAALPLVMSVHGGFWRPQYDRTHAGPMSVALARSGWTVATIEYRRVPGNPDATLHDIAAAVATLPDLIRHHNGSVLLIGHSAGGHLVLWAAVKCWTPKLKGVVALAPVADLRRAEVMNLGSGAVRLFLGTDPAARPDFDPMQLPAPSAPITIVQGAGDLLVPPALAESYASAFPKTRLVLLPASGHYAVIDPMSSAWPVVVDELEKLSHP